MAGEEKQAGAPAAPLGREALKILLTNGYQEYRHLAIDRQNIQLAYTKTYITLSSVILGALISAIIFLKIASGDTPLPLPKSWADIFSYISIFLSFGLALAVFIGGLDLLRGREKRPLPFAALKKSFVWLKENRSLFASEEELTINLLESLLDPLTTGLEDLTKMVERIGNRLRLMSWGLIAATAFGLLGVAIRVFTS